MYIYVTFVINSLFSDTLLGFVRLWCKKYVLLFLKNCVCANCRGFVTVVDSLLLD